MGSNRTHSLRCSSSTRPIPSCAAPTGVRPPLGAIAGRGARAGRVELGRHVGAERDGAGSDDVARRISQCRVRVARVQPAQRQDLAEDGAERVDIDARFLQLAVAEQRPELVARGGAGSGRGKIPGESAATFGALPHDHAEETMEEPT